MPMASPVPDLDPLCCLEDHHWVDSPSLSSLDLSCHPSELLHLSSKEKGSTDFNAQYHSSGARREAVGWLLRASARFGFTAQTTLLAVNYLDSFLSRGQQQQQQQQQPWMAQLCSVACLSLAAKVEETHVPLLLDLQLEETRFVFEAKTIQRMELLVLSTLGWRMNPVTPLSFVDHIVRRMALHEEINEWWNAFDPVSVQEICNATLISIVSDPHWFRFVPSVLAGAAVLFALLQLNLVLDGTSQPMDLVNQISELLDTTKEDVLACHQFIVEHLKGDGNKRKYAMFVSPPSPNAIIDSTFSMELSNDSWGSSVLSSSPVHCKRKKLNNGAWMDMLQGVLE